MINDCLYDHKTHLLTSTLLFFLLLMTTNLCGQESLFSLPEKFAALPSYQSGVVSQVEMLYGSSPMSADSAVADTVIQIGGMDHELFTTQTDSTDYVEPYRTVTRHYDAAGKYIFTTTRNFDEEGRLIREETDGPLPSAKSFEYDEVGRIRKVTENGRELFNIEYLENGLPGTITGNFGFGKMAVEIEDLGDRLRYQFKAESKFLTGMMGKEYTDLMEKDGKFYIYSYEEDEEADSMKLKQLEIVDQDLKLLEEIVDADHIKFHHIYEYDENGVVRKRTDHLTGEIHVWEYDANGNPTKTFEELQAVYYRYDERGNKIMEYKFFPYMPDTLQSLTIRTFDYSE